MSRNNYNAAAIQNPDGGICMATIESDNPYVALTDDTVASVEAIPVNNNNNVSLITIANTNLVLVVPNSMARRVVEAQRYSCGIKFICMLDFIMNFIYVLNGYWLTIIFSIFSLYGYYSTYTHERRMLCGYLLYQYAITLGKFSAFMFYCLMLNDSIADSFHKDYPNLVLPRDIPSAIVYSLFLFLIQTYIAFYVRRYYYLLPTNNEKNEIYIANREIMV